MRTHPTPTHIDSHSEPETSHQQQQHPLRPSISGPSLCNSVRRSPEWCVTENDVFRNASPIRHPLIEHPDLEKGFQRPKEWGEKTPDLIEAELISRQMREIDRSRAERRGKSQEAKGKEEEDRIDRIESSRNEHVEWQDEQGTMF